MKQDELVNLRRKNDITPDEVRNLPTFRDWDDQKIYELIRIIKTFTQIAYHVHKGQKDGKVIALHIDNQHNIAA